MPGSAERPVDLECTTTASERWLRQSPRTAAVSAQGCARLASVSGGTAMGDEGFDVTMDDLGGGGGGSTLGESWAQGSVDLAQQAVTDQAGGWDTFAQNEAGEASSWANN